MAVDVDSYKEDCGWSAFITEHDMPDTLTQTSGRGGTHYLFRCEEGERFAGHIPGVDGVELKHQGYILVEPSQVEGRAYRWRDVDATEPAECPEWLPKARAWSGFAFDGIELDTEEAIERAKAYLVDHAPEAVEGAGGDDTTFRVAAAVKDYAVSQDTCLDLLLDHWNATKAIPPWEPEELERKVANAYRYGQGAMLMAPACLEFDAVPDPEPEKLTEASWPRPATRFDFDAIPPRRWIVGGT